MKFYVAEVEKELEKANEKRPPPILPAKKRDKITDSPKSSRHGHSKLPQRPYIRETMHSALNL